MEVRTDELIPAGRFEAEIARATVEWSQRHEDYIKLDLTLCKPDVVRNRQLFGGVTWARLGQLAAAMHLPVPLEPGEMRYFCRAIIGRRLLVDVAQYESPGDGITRVVTNVIHHYWPLP